MKLSKILYSFLQERIQLSLKKPPIRRIGPRGSAPKVWQERYDNYIKTYGMGLELAYANSELKICFEDAEKDVNYRIKNGLQPKRVSNKIKQKFLRKREERWDNFVEVFEEISGLGHVSLTLTWKEVP